ncbi:MAG: PAS domain-containing sensor histidine kinase, partial [Methanomicrobiales archaeon]|nr:PAS domain-containing sensor histidine kinase [Methanomicrobiales archaeon]
DKFKEVYNTGIPSHFENYSKELDTYIELSIYSPQKGQIALISSDITERRRAEEEVIQARRNFEVFFNTIDEFLYVLDEQGRILHVNETVIRRLGYTREEILGQPVLMVHPPERRDEAGLTVQGMLAGTMDFCPVPVMTRDGHLIPVETRVVQGEWDGSPVLFGVSKDITDLKVSEEKFSAAFHSNAAAMAVSTKHDGKFVDVNAAFLQMLGFTRDEVIGKSVGDLHLFLQPEDRIHAIRILEEGGVVRNLEVQVQAKDGSALYGLFSADSITIGEIPCLLTTMVDITERKNLEEEMKFHEQELMQFSKSLATANKKLTLLSSITRHDINNQLTVLMGFLSILEDMPPGPAREEYFQKTSTAAKRISAMVQFTKEYEEIGVHAPAWQECRILVETASKQAPLGKVMVKNDLPVGTEVFADPLVVKVFYNLMDNAVRYGGKITTIRFSVEDDGDDHVIVCEDDGDGIVAAEKKKIFERGFGKNTGLGLAISREILDITGITIKETGGPGQGARFEITVPKGAWK